jgi:hypothetical protein
MGNAWNLVPDWASFENQGGGIAIADLDGDGKPELLVLRVDSPTPGPNRGFYRVGKGLDANGQVTAGWGPWSEVPRWGSAVDQGTAIAVSDLDGDGKPELIVMHIVHRVPGPNQGQYRVGKTLDRNGQVTGGWGPWIDIPNWTSLGNQGAGIAIGDLDGDGKPEIIVFQIEDFHSLNPARPNKGTYRVGKALDASGVVTGGWGDWFQVDWFSWFNQGAGLALRDLDGNGRPELIVFQIDDPPGENGGFYRIAWNLDATGFPRDGWGPWQQVPAWGSWEDQGAGFALADLGGGLHPKAVIFHIDNPPGLNAGQFRLDDLQVDLDTAASIGVWRLMPYFSQVLPVHAALLHTGRVLFFAGSGNNAFRFNSPDFGNEAKQIYTSVVWDYAANSFAHPPTLHRNDAKNSVIDFFCCGHCALADGRILVGGGTIKYDMDIVNGAQVPDAKGFFGSIDSVIFDPEAEKWASIASMANGRWYPTMLRLASGSVLATSGLDSNGALNQTIEINTNPDSAPWTKTRAFALPLYPHLFLLGDGRLFYSGGKMDSPGDSAPLVFDPVNPTNAVGVSGLDNPGLCNQSASVLMPPAQDQKVMIMGGGPEDEGEATARVSLVNLKAANPQYAAQPPMNFNRIHVNAVLLPDRTILATGGGGTREASQGGTIDPQLVRERLVAEIFDPAAGPAGTWSKVAQAQVARLYHSVALLLPDGRVVAAGGNPNKGSQVPWLPPDPLEEERLEMYYPPYLFQKGKTRPVIANAPTEIGYGAKFTIGTAQANAIGSVNLIRPGLTTHSFNVEQRLVDVPFVVVANTLQATVPNQPNIAPPGWYMLFLTGTNKVPSVATWVHLS